MQFKHWVNENVFRYDPQGNIKPELLLQLAAIRRDPRFAQYGDDQIEMMLLHHTLTMTELVLNIHALLVVRLCVKIVVG